MAVMSVGKQVGRKSAAPSDTTPDDTPIDETIANVTATDVTTADVGRRYAFPTYRAHHGHYDKSIKLKSHYLK